MFRLNGFPFRTAITFVCALNLGMTCVACSHDDADDASAQVSVESLLISVDDLQGDMERGVELVLIDVRSETAFNAGHIPGAINIPGSVFATRLGELDQRVSYVTYCAAGNGASGAAAQTLAGEGFDQVAVLDGGYPAWDRATSETTAD